MELRVASAETLEGVGGRPFDATLARWGLMYMHAPVAALTAARRAMVPAGVLVAALWVEPEAATFFTLPRRVLARYRELPGREAADVPVTASCEPHRPWACGVDAPHGSSNTATQP